MKSFESLIHAPELASATHVVPVSSSRPAILGAPILLGAVFTFSAGCAVAAIDPTPRKALHRERHEGVFIMKSRSIFIAEAGRARPKSRPHG